MKTILLLAPLVDIPDRLRAQIKQIKEGSNPQEYVVCELLDVYMQAYDQFGCSATPGTLIAYAVWFLIDKADEVWLLHDPTNSKEYRLLLQAAIEFGKRIVNKDATRQNFAIRSVGHPCPLDKIPITADLCRQCDRLVCIYKNNKKVICKIPHNDE